MVELQTSELRYNPLTDQWVIIAPGRKHRPFQEKHISCPFCPGAVEVPNPINDPIILPNKYPSLTIHAQSSMDKHLPGKGICEVILYSSNHDLDIVKMKDNQVTKIVSLWQKRFNELITTHDFIEYVYFFENSGKEIGISIEHPHGQLYALPIIPPKIRRELEYLSTHECVFCKKTNYFPFKEQNSFLISIPSFMRWPYEIHIFPKRHVSLIKDLSNQEITDLAKSIKYTLTLLTKFFNKKYPYILSLHQAPHKHSKKQYYHLHLELITPMKKNGKLKYAAGLEEGTGIFINSNVPEQVIQDFLELDSHEK